MYLSVVASLLLLATSFVSAEYQPSAQTLAQNDIAVLQYALLLENLEYTFYSTYQAQYSAADFQSIGLTSNDYSLFNLIRDHEKSHVGLLSSVVPNPGNCTYNFGVNSVSDYIKVARVLENTGVSAYDGAINNFYSPAFAQIAATIATIEARHASYLNNLNHVSPFPSAFDNATAPAVIAGALFNTQGSIATCQFAAGFVLPQFYTVYPVQNASDPSQPTPANLLGNDIKVLNYALFLEHLEAQFYAFVLQNFSASQFGSNVTYNYIQAIASHEATHVSALTSIISQLGGSPIAACQYNFAGAINGNISTALTIAAALEATGVGAYDGAVNAINNGQLKEAAATIATVEARHASYLNYITNNAQGPVQGAAGAYDIALTFSNVTGIVATTNLIVSCPANPQAFSVLIVQPYTNATFNSSTSGSTTGASTTGAATTAAATTGAATTGVVTTGATTSTPTPAPTPSPSTTGTTTGATTTGSVTTGTPTASPSTTGSATGASTTTAGTTTAGATTRATSTTSGASIASASVVVVALLVAVAAF